jgi:hypothetical protein
MAKKVGVGYYGGGDKKTPPPVSSFGESRRCNKIQRRHCLKQYSFLYDSRLTGENPKSFF